MDRDLRRSDDSRAMGHGRGNVPAKTVGVLWDPDSGTPIGTCFAFRHPGIFLTAAHVVERRSASDLKVHVSRGRAFKIGRAAKHPEKDVAVLKLRSPGFSDDDFDCFELAEPPRGTALFSEPVVSFGYALNNRSREPEPRWIQGHVQRLTMNGGYELSHPSLPGNSGSPVMLGSNHSDALALTHRNLNISYKDLSPEGNTVCLVSYAMAVALSPLADWLEHATRK